MHYSSISCLKCKIILEIRVLGLCTGLGPSTVICGKCGTLNQLARKEWAEFRSLDYFKFVLFSAVGISFLALLGAIVSGMAYPAPENVPWGRKEIENSWFYVGGLLFVFLGILLQTYRVIASRKRTSANPTLGFRQSMFELQTGVQFKVIFIVVAVGILGTTVSYVAYVTR